MTFEQLYKVLLKRWSIIVIAFLLVAIGAYIGSSKLITPRYQSMVQVEVIVRVGGTPLTSDNIQASMSLAQTEVSLVKTDSVLKSVAPKYPGLTEGDLSDEITATVNANAPIFDIAVLDPSPTQAASIAEAVASSLIAQQTQLIVPSPTEGNFLEVVEHAQPATAPSQPNKLINTAAGAVIGLILGMAAAILRELLDKRVRSSAAVTALVNWIGLGSIGQADAGASSSVQANYNANADAYSTLRANVGFASRERSLHIYSVTSLTQGDGKSTVAANLAVSMARSGRKTLLVDANLRHPTLHEIFTIPSHMKGFSNALLALKLSGNVTAQQVLTRTMQSDIPNGFSLAPFVQTVSVPNLAVMPSGPIPSGPSELLGSDAVQRFFTVLRQAGTEVVIFDSSSLLGLPDATILASKVDATLVVIDMTNAKKASLKQARALLDRAGAHVLGYVANKLAHPESDPSPYKDVTQTAERWNQREHEGGSGDRHQSGENFYQQPNQIMDVKKDNKPSYAAVPQTADANRGQQLLKQKREQ